LCFFLKKKVLREIYFKNHIENFSLSTKKLSYKLFENIVSCLLENRALRAL
jgi:hypothetical protein